MYRLRFFGGEHDGETYPLHRARGVIIGRSPTNNVYVRDKNVSRVHCQVTVTDVGCLIADLQSTNGTFVNGQRITEKLLKVADEIRVERPRFGSKTCPTRTRAPLTRSYSEATAEAPTCRRCVH